MQFIPQKAIKGQTVADFFADHPVSGSSKLYNNLPDEIAEVNATHVSSEEQVELHLEGGWIGVQANLGQMMWN